MLELIKEALTKKNTKNFERRNEEKKKRRNEETKKG